jgi:hypothetical protein
LDLQASADLDIWSIGKDYADVHLVPNTNVSKAIRETLNCEIFVEDLEQHFQTVPATGVPAAPEGFYDQYPTYQQIVDKCQELANTYPTLAKYYPSLSGGKSVQGNNMPYLVITGTGTGSKWNFHIEGGLHAREWIGPITTLYLAENLLSQYTTNAVVKSQMDSIVFHIAPMMNPDGYLYTWCCDRNWRKNRQTNTGGSMGVDLNRNFDDHWGGPGSSGVPTSDTYRGPSAASEPETKAVQAYVRGLTNKLAGIDYHSYGPLVLRSWGWTSTPSSDESWLKPIGDKWALTINSVNGQNYVSEKAAELYVASGCEDDWVSVQSTRGHGWTIELRGRSFVLPPAEITPTGRENFAGLLNMTGELLNRFGRTPSPLPPTEQTTTDRRWNKWFGVRHSRPEPRGP